ncbi:DJ-1 family protein [Clostridium fermenticellae]|uniref:DJ-1 family protein n=1 Tax=Clostridium fermenticellae TaxID=2068654 RepID=A0A386H4U4_9CLOT|nr:DJ-1 family glyoxalase III [Clostridium fermenticellae]AYD40739.1 DJ-1 family protein [Clostridium fermenticellae]
MKKALVLFADGFEEIEALTVVDVLRRGGVRSVICSADDNKCISGAHDVIVKSDMSLCDIDESEYDALIVPGGMPGAENLKNNDRVINLIKKFNNENKILGAICAGPIVFEKAGILGNMKATSYPGFKEKLNARTYIENELVVQDGNIITSRGPATAAYFSLKVLENLEGKGVSDSVKKDMLIDFVEDII